VIYSKKEENIFVVKNKERKGSEVFKRLVKKIYSTIKITTNIISVMN